MDKVTAFFVGEILKIQEEDPERFWEIKNYECPHHYGLPSFKQDHTCELYSCEKCWQEAMSARSRKRDTVFRKMWRQIKDWAKRMKGAFR